MTKIVSLQELIAGHIHEGQTLALEGFTHLIPFAAGHEIIRQGIQNLTLIRMTPDLIYDQLIGVGLVKKIVFSWGGNPGVGSLYRLRDAIEKGIPQPLEWEEHSHAAMACAYQAGASGLPFGILRGYTGTDLAKENPAYIKWVDCPFTGEKLAAIKAINPDVTIIHAQQADKKGNVKIWGITGVQKEAAYAAKKVLVTVEEVVDELDKTYQGIYIPHWLVAGITKVPGGAHPSYAMGYSQRNNQFYKSWDGISKDMSRFQEWIETQVMNKTQDA
ncbi:CoA transferase subunit A [Pararhodonellum marinum]|uniref:CoA transferase subunit A n=1 Tax=Pararhodonellum marinum TaxID=2755358 RepID=UPI00188EA4DD|nr:CoA transferase subunit A [Pararhodonellum marinum]